MPRSLSEDLNNPNLFVDNKPGVYTYSNDNGYGKTAYGSLQLTDNPKRDAKAQAAAGGDKRRGQDHEWGPDDGGHLIGARFGGETGEVNLTAQNRSLNRGDYKKMENEWANHLEANDKVFVNIEADDELRPNAYMGYVIYEAPDGTRTHDTFHMLNESREEIAQWEAEAEAFEAAQWEAEKGEMAEKDAGENPYLGEAVSTESAGQTADAEFSAGTAQDVSADSDMSAAPSEEAGPSMDLD